MITNRNTKEPCYVKFTAAVPAGAWYVVNDEDEEISSLGGETEISSETLASGIYLHAPPFDNRGYRIQPVLDA